MAATWPQLLRNLWVTAACLGTALIACLCVDVLRTSSVAPRGGKRRSLHQRLFARLHPSQSATGKLIELAAILLGLAQWVLYLSLCYYSSWNATSITSVALFNGFFVLRYALRAAMTEPGRLFSWALHPDRVCDVVATASSLAPLITAYYRYPGWNFGFLRIINVVCAYDGLQSWLVSSQRMTRLQDFFIRAVMMAFSFLVVLSATVSTLEQAGNPDNWGYIVSPPGEFTSVSSMYWAVITVGTVGYGDMAPVTFLGRLITGLFLLLGLVLFSALLTRFVDELALRRSGRGTFYSRPGQPHVVVTGEVEAEPLVCLLRGLLLHSRTAQQPLHVCVLIDGESYTDDLVTAVRKEPALSHRVTILRGDVFEAGDLRRAGIGRPECQTVFVLQRLLDADDTPNLLRVLALRRAVEETSILVMIADSDNAAFLRSAGCPEESILALDEVRLGLAAGANAIAPGAAPLLLSLLRGGGDATLLAASTAMRVPAKARAAQVPLEAVAATTTTRARPRAGTGVPLAPASAAGADPSIPVLLARGLLEELAADAASETRTFEPPSSWMDEYAVGVVQEMHEIVCPPWLVGRTLMDAAIIVYCSKLIRHSAKTSIIVPTTGLEPPAGLDGSPSDAPLRLMVAAMGEREGPVLIGLRHAHHRGGGVAMRFDLASPHVLRTNDSLFIIALDLSVLGRDIVALGRKILGDQPGLARLVQSFSAPPDVGDGTPEEAPEEHGAGMAQSLSALPLAALAMSPLAVRAEAATPAAPPSTTARRPAAASRAPLPRTPWADLGGPGPPPPQLSGHIVLVTNELASLHHFILPLRYAGGMRPIVVITSATKGEAERCLEDLRSRFRHMHPIHRQATSDQGCCIYFTFGSSLHGAVLIRAGLLRARRCVVLAGTAKTVLTVHPGHGLESTLPKTLTVLTTLVIENALAGVAPALLYGAATEVTREASYKLLGPVGWSAGRGMDAGASFRSLRPPRERQPLALTRSFAESPGGASVGSGGGSPPVVEEDGAASTDSEFTDESSPEGEGGVEPEARIEAHLEAHFLHGWPLGRTTSMRIRRPDDVLDADENLRTTAAEPAGAVLASAAAGEARSPPVANGARTEPQGRAAAWFATLLGRPPVGKLERPDDVTEGQDRPSGWVWCERYASGKLLPALASYAILAAAYWHPSTLRLVRLLGRGDTVQVRHLAVPPEVLHAPGCPHRTTAAPPPEQHSSFPSLAQAFQRFSSPARGEVPAPALCACTAPFARVFLHVLLTHAVATIGVFREQTWAGAALPYVTTNPGLATRVRSGDVLFVLVPVARGALSSA